MSTADWWKSYFDAQYLLEYEPIFNLVRDRREVARLMEILALPSGARVLDVPAARDDTRICSPRPVSGSTAWTTRRI